MNLEPFKLDIDDLINEFVDGEELEVDMLSKLSREYAEAKGQAIAAASKMVDVENMKHLADGERLISEEMEKNTQDWNTQKELFYRETGLGHRTSEGSKQLQAQENSGREDNESLQQGEENESSEQDEEDDEFGDQLEEMLSSD